MIGLNPHDQRSRDTGLLITDKLPAVLSKDVVGTVSQVGDGVANLRIGDRVMSLGSGAVTDSSQSGFQQYALADAVNCANIPNNISDDEAVCVTLKTVQPRSPTNFHAGNIPYQCLCSICGSFRRSRSAGTMGRRQGSP